MSLTEALQDWEEPAATVGFIMAGFCSWSSSHWPGDWRSQRGHPPLQRSPTRLSASRVPTGVESIPRKKVRRRAHARVANYSVALLTYADDGHGGIHKYTQRLLTSRHSRQRAGIDHIFNFDAESLRSTSFGRGTLLAKAIARFGPTARWIWKPFLILDALSRLRDGDFVVYADASRHILHGLGQPVTPLTNLLFVDAARASPHRTELNTFGMIPGLRLPLRNRDALFYNGSSTHADHHNSLRRCDLCEVVWHLGLCAAADEACCDSYLYAPHVQAAVSIWQRNRQVESFLRLWRAAVENMEVLQRSKWGDQSVLSLYVTWYSRTLGLKVPYVRMGLSSPALLSQIPNGTCGALRGPRVESLRGDARTRCTAAKVVQKRIFHRNRQLKDPELLFSRVKQLWRRARRPIVDGALLRPVLSASALTGGDGGHGLVFLHQDEQYPECHAARHGMVDGTDCEHGGGS